MSTLLKTAAIALAAGLAANSAQAIDPFFPQFGNNGIDVLHYGLGLDTHPANGRLDAKALLTIVAQRELSSFSLDLHGLTVSRVVVDGHSATFSHAGGKLTITPRRPIEKGRRFSVFVSYGGTPSPIQDPTAPGDPSYQLGWFKYQDTSYALSEPVGASTFYPANDEPTDKALFTFLVSVPSGYTGVANGELTSSWRTGDRKHFLWHMSEPMTTWLATVQVNRFDLTQQRIKGGTTISVYATPATPPKDVAGYLRAGEMLTDMERLVGPYPFDSYGSVVVDDPALYYALETQAMSTFPLDVHARPDFVAHELAHQWFGNSVSVAKWEDLWIAEGLATYFEVLLPNLEDPAEFEAQMRAIYDYVVQEAIGPAVVDAPDQLFSDRTYLRGAMAIYALKLEVGDKILFKILRRFAHDFRGGNVTSADFIRTAVRVSGDASVRPLLRAWLYQEAVPALPGKPAPSAARRGRVPVPDVVGLACGLSAHRKLAAHCASAASR